ncbi:MAG: hypothetical protein NC223_06060 [Butyrivibrio sp.]|nr:hypothetical protein [Butyrivibrio sp.]
MVYTSRKRNFRRFIKTHNLKYYFAFLAMVLAIVAAVIVITKNNRAAKPSDDRGESATPSEYATEAETELSPETVRGIYKLELNLANGYMAAYEWDAEKASFSEEAARYMLFAALDITEGELSAPYASTDKSAWTASERDERFYRYATSFGGKIIFHSPDYGVLGDKNSLIADSYAAIDEGGADNLSAGITLTVADAKWIYENCSFESEIKIYSDAGAERGEAANRIIPIPEGITWEPTDASNGTPWCQTEIAELSAPPIFELSLGAPETVVLNSAKALDKSGTDVSEYVYFTGECETDKPGVYNLSYNLIDIFGNHLQQPLRLTVKAKETVPETEATTAETVSETVTEGEDDEPSTTESSAFETETDSSEPDTSDTSADESTDTLPETPSQSEAISDSGEESSPTPANEHEYEEAETTEELPPSSDSAPISP